MFSTPESLRRRTGKSSLDRSSYLKQLIHEYESPETTEDKREQVLANLANFAYDPINYEFFRRFNVMDIFIRNLAEFTANGALFTESLSENKIKFSIGGICNLCLDLKNRDYLLKNNLIRMIYFHLANIKDNEEIVLTLITTLIFLFDESTRSEIVSNETVNSLIKNLSESSNQRISNLAKVFVEDCLCKKAS